MPPITNKPNAPLVPGPQPASSGTGRTGKQVITFSNNREAAVIFPAAGATANALLNALNLKQPNAALVLIGGADSLDEKVTMRLVQLFGRGIARAAIELKALIIDGGTEAGAMKLMGQGVADRGFKSNLVGVAPYALVSYPGNEKPENAPLDPNHSHFILVDGNEWGSETGMLFKLAGGIAAASPTMVMVVGGGDVTKKECLQAVRQSLPLMVIEGTGGIADEIAAAWKTKPELPDDPVMAEIVDDGRIQFHVLGNPVNEAERMLVRELGGENVLRHAWERFADYDLNAKRLKKRFQQQQVAILLVGIFITALALFNQIYDGNSQRLGFDVWWPALKGENVGVTRQQTIWTIIHYLLLASPIVITVLVAAASRFNQGNKWLLVRACAESIKREIYRFRARADAYAEQPSTAAGSTPSLTAEQVLAQRIEDATRRCMRSEVSSSSLVSYDKSKGFPPDMDAAKGGDDGFSPLTPSQYINLRLADQLRYYRSKALKLEKEVKVVQWSIFIVGGLGTFLAAINQQIWVALTTSLATAFATFLSYRQSENTLMKYNQGATDLDNVKSWWAALPGSEQAKQENITALVNHTEQVLEMELAGWMQQMQDALAKLRQGQAEAEAKKVSPPEEGPPVAESTPEGEPYAEGEPPAEGGPPAEGEPEATEEGPADEGALDESEPPPAYGEQPAEGETPMEGEAPPDEIPSEKEE